MLELPIKQSNTPVQEQTLENHANNDTQHHFSDAEYNKAPIQQQYASSINGLIKRKLLLLSPLLICLYVLTDTTHHIPNNNNDTKQHLAFITALSRHPPALRVFRIVSESAFLLFCTAFALWAWEACDYPSSIQNYPNDASLEQHSNNNDDDEQTTTIGIPSQTVGKLLFAPPPKPITDNAAWRVYKKHHHRLVFRRGKERSSSSSGSLKTGRDGMRDEEQDDLLKVSNQQRHKSEEDEKDLDVLPLIEHQSVQQDPVDDRRGDNYDDDYIDNKENGIRNGTNVQFTEETTASSLPPKPPSSTSVLGAALDITTVMCIFLIFFTISSAEGGKYIDHKARGTININPSSNHIQDNLNDETAQEHDNNNEISYMKLFAKIAAPLFPITLFILSIFLLIIPWKKRKVLWTIVSLTLGAPYYEVTFRDGFVGDILTSAVRPLQDLAYTVVFLGVGLQSWWAQAYNNGGTTADGDTSSSSLDDVPLERSWLLHTLILPACTLSPLWWRFLQNLRQCFDAKQRWPYLGNAFKYMLAAEVAIFGMFDPSVKKHPVWIMCFFVATLYQVWWDVFMDWGLLEWDEDTVAFAYYHSNGSRSGGRRGLFWWWPYKLRSRRAYPHRWMYYTIFIINFCLRFVGMLTLIPPVYLSRQTGLIVNTWYDPDFQLFVGSMAASAEIFRRTIWALLRLEWEVIKTSPVQPLMSEKSEEGEDDDLLDLLGEETDMKPMAISSSSMISNVRSSRISLESLSDMSNLNGIQILSELCAWATIFSGIAIIAAAHREVL